MKKIFLRVVLPLLAVGLIYSASTGFGGKSVSRQQDSLRFGDTTATFDLGGGVTDLWLTVQDSSNGSDFIDSIRAYVKTGTQTTIGVMWSNVAGHELSQTTSTTDVNLLIPGTAKSSTYYFHFDVPIYSFYVARMNVGGVLPPSGYPVKTPVAITYND